MEFLNNVYLAKKRHKRGNNHDSEWNNSKGGHVLLLIQELNARL